MRLWRRPAATAPIRLLAREPPYAAGAALERQKRQKKKKKKKKGKNSVSAKTTADWLKHVSSLDMISGTLVQVLKQQRKLGC